ncbi:CAP domain-containing protein [Mycobacterium sp. NPDC003449]
MALLTAPTATADNSRLNSTVISNVYTVQRQAGCTGQLTPQPQLRLAAQRHVADVLANPDLNGDIGSDGTDPQRRAAAFGYQGEVSETVAINPGLAISGIELINQWFANAAYLATMRDCRFTQIGVWSENSINRSVVVATYGNPSVGSGEKG